MNHLLSQIPAINKILLTEDVRQLLEDYPEKIVKDVIKKEIEDIKNNIIAGNLSEVPPMEEIIRMVEKEVRKQNKTFTTSTSTKV